jgi:hypothetical protein
MKCRHCAAVELETFLDLGCAPPSNSYLQRGELRQQEVYYPLRLAVCLHCWLVQTEDYARPEELFRADYAYFSSTSTSWLAHAKRYSDAIIQRLLLDRQSLVVEIASNDGYLLKNFLAAGIPCLGIEPTADTAAAAEHLGIPVIREFFTSQLGQQLAAQGKKASLIVGNNVYAHVPDINDFTLGLKHALAPSGTITLEFPHLLGLIENVQFDTIYHEHFSYLSLSTAERILREARLRVYDVEELPTHGGSLRIYVCHEEESRSASPRVAALKSKEKERGLGSLTTYRAFQAAAEQVKDSLLIYLIAQKRRGRKVVGYGAAAKGNTLLNYAGVRRDLLPYVADKAPSKQGRFLPGSRIPIVDVTTLCTDKPDIVIILPWNLAKEILAELRPRLPKTTRFVTAVPKIQLKREVRARHLRASQPFPAHTD